jgi:hypothetical protein
MGTLCPLDECWTSSAPVFVVLIVVLASPRRRRRLTIASIAVVVTVPLVYLAAHYTTSGSPGNATGPYVNEDRFYEQPKHVPFTVAKRNDVSAVLAKFIDGAVARHDLPATWNLAGPGIREGVTHSQWLKGDIPVVPYPASKRGAGSWNLVNYSYRDRVGLELLLFPRPGSGYSVATVEADVARGSDRHWRVDYWMVTKLHGPGATAAADSASALSEGPPKVHKLPKGKKKQLSAASEPSDVTTGGARLDAKWLFAPLALVLLVIALPIAAGRLRRRREAD